jgi:hypothetical protein
VKRTLHQRHPEDPPSDSRTVGKTVLVVLAIDLVIVIGLSLTNRGGDDHGGVVIAIMLMIIGIAAGLFLIVYSILRACRGNGSDVGKGVMIGLAISLLLNGGYCGYVLSA